MATPCTSATTTRSGGAPCSTSAALYERVSLEGFQSGLSWLTILRKREAFRSAFAGFDPERGCRVRSRRRRAAAGRRGDRAQPPEDRGHDRERPRGARAARERHVVPRAGARPSPARAALPRELSQRSRRSTPESTALAKALRKEGFRFVGPTTATPCSRRPATSTTTSQAVRCAGTSRLAPARLG